MVRLWPVAVLSLFALTACGGGDDDNSRVADASPGAVDAVSTLDPDAAPAATLMVFVSERDGNPEIYSMEQTGAGQTRLTVDTVELLDDDRPLLSPDGSKIAFTSKSATSTELYVMDTDGQNVKQLTALGNGYIGSPAWSPDGMRIAFSYQDIFVVSADGSSAPQNLTNKSSFHGTPAWSPDGNTIAYAAFNSPDGMEVYSIASDGAGSAVTVTTHAAPEEVHRVAWSPDGTKISFLLKSGSKTQVYVMDADGMNELNLSNCACKEFGMAWSPDSSKIAFRSDRDGDLEIYVTTADGATLTNLTNDAAADSHPIWSRDGTQITFVTDRDGNLEVYVMDADGTGPTNLTNNTADDSAPHW